MALVPSIVPISGIVPFVPTSPAAIIGPQEVTFIPVIVTVPVNVFPFCARLNCCNSSMLQPAGNAVTGPFNASTAVPSHLPENPIPENVFVFEVCVDAEVEVLLGLTTVAVFGVTGREYVLHADLS